MTDLSLLVTPATSEGYHNDFGTSVVFSKHDGPSMLLRQGYSGAPDIVAVSWELDHQGYAYFKAFWRQRTERGASPFLIDLVTSEALPTRHVAQFVPETLKLSKIDGLRYTVVAALELSPPLAE